MPIVRSQDHTMVSTFALCLRLLTIYVKTDPLTCPLLHFSSSSFGHAVQSSRYAGQQSALLSPVMHPCVVAQGRSAAVREQIELDVVLNVSQTWFTVERQKGRCISVVLWTLCFSAAGWVLRSHTTSEPRLFVVLARVRLALACVSA